MRCPDGDVPIGLTVQATILRNQNQVCFGWLAKAYLLKLAGQHHFDFN